MQGAGLSNRWLAPAPDAYPWRDRAFLGAVLVGVGVLLVQLLDYGFGRDQGIFAVVATTLREGGIPYRDAWDFKPPGIYFIYALAPSVTGIRIVEAISLCLLVVAFASISQVYMRDWRSGVVGAGIAVLVHVQMEFWHTAQPEGFGAVLIAWGMTLAALASRTRSTKWDWRWYAVGICYSAAALLKPMMGAAALGSIVAALLAMEKPVSPRAWFARGTAIVGPFTCGAALPIGACLGWFLLRGGLPDLIDALTRFAPAYVALAWSQTNTVQVARGLVEGWLVGYTLLNVVGLILLLPLQRTSERLGVIHALLVIGLLLAGVMAQGRLFPYHFGAVLPITSLMAGWGYWRLWQRWRDRWSRIVAFVALLTILVAGRSATTDVADSFLERCRLRLIAWTDHTQRQEIRDRLYSVVDYAARDNRLVTNWLVSNTPDGASIYVYGFSPEIYLSAARPAASRYIYNVPQRATWSRQAARETLLEELRQSPPAAIVVERGDVMGWVTGTRDDSKADLSKFPELRGLISQVYREEESIGKFDVYRRTR